MGLNSIDSISLILKIVDILCNWYIIEIVMFNLYAYIILILSFIDGLNYILLKL